MASRVEKHPFKHHNPVTSLEISKFCTKQPTAGGGGLTGMENVVVPKCMHACTSMSGIRILEDYLLIETLTIYNSVIYWHLPMA